MDLHRQSGGSELAAQIAPSSALASIALRELADALRNPMQAIAGYLEILTDQWLSDLAPRPREIVDRIRARAAILSRTIDNVLEAARAAASSEAAADEEIATADLIADLIPTLQAAAEGRSFTLLAEIAAAPRIFRSDLRRIRSILLNLAMAAIERTRADAITISVAGLSGDSDSPDPAIQFEILVSGGERASMAFVAFEPLVASSEAGIAGGFVAALMLHHLAALGASLVIKHDCAHASRAVLTIADRRRCASASAKGGTRRPIRAISSSARRRAVSSAIPRTPPLRTTSQRRR